MCNRGIIQIIAWCWGKYEKCWNQHLAIMFGDVGIVKLLFEVIGRDAFELRDQLFDSTLKRFAVSNDHIKIVKLCIEFGS